MREWLSTLAAEFDWYALYVLGPIAAVLATDAAVGGWRALVYSMILMYLGFKAGVVFTRRAMLRELFVTGRIKSKKSDGG